MKQLIFGVLFLLPIFNWAQSAPLSSIQLGTFVNPKKSDFSTLQSLGYLYAEPAGNNFYKVFLGEFSNETVAKTTLNAVEAKGYSGFIVPRPLVNKSSAIVVQFATKARQDNTINWSILSQVGKLYAVLTDPNRIKLVTGPFPSMAIARERVSVIKQLGYHDAFVKSINVGLLHSVNEFEMGINSVQSGLNQAVELIINEKGIPTDFEAPSSKIVLPKAANTPKIGSTPTIRPLIKRTSALDIQKVLKANKYYNGSLDGFYGKGTQKGFEQFIAEDPIYQKYKLLNQHLSTPSDKKENNEFQALINALPHNTVAVTNTLKTLNTPLAKAYQAYWLLVNGGSITTINQLMNTAIKEAFADKKIKNAPPFDFNANYSYEDLTQFILHLRYLHATPKNDDIAIPCWLFEQHPKEAYAAFKTKSKFASFANTKIGQCKNFEAWPPIKMMNTIIQELQPQNLSKEQIDRNTTLAAARNFQYLFPEKLNPAQKKATDKWLRTFWGQLESSSTNYPVLEKNLVTLKVLFYQSQVLLEDYFMDKEFRPNDAEGLALSILKTYVEVPLEVYGL